MFVWGVVFRFGVGIVGWVRVGVMKSVPYTSRMGWRALVGVWGVEDRRKQAKYGAVTGSSASERPMYDLSPP